MPRTGAFDEEVANEREAQRCEIHARIKIPKCSRHHRVYRRGVARNNRTDERAFVGWTDDFPVYHAVVVRGRVFCR